MSAIWSHYVVAIGIYGGACPLRPLMFLVFRESSIKGFTLLYSVGVAKLSVERGFASVQLGTDYCPLYGVAGYPLFRGF